MASIASDGNGLRRIQFMNSRGQRKAIRLGKASMKQAEAFKVKVEQLVTASLFGHPPDDETCRWLSSLDDVIYDRIAATGLIKARSSLRLKDFVDGYIKGRVDVKPGTAIVLSHTRRCLVEHFGAEKCLREITLGDADAFRLYLIGQKLADNTVRRRCGIAKQFFRAALRQKLVRENVFADLPAAVQENRAKMYFISLAEAYKVLDACPDAQWRLMFALSRFGGLRCPSEHVRLKWEHVNWEKGRFLVHSPKTEHHAGGESRWVPIFPELLPYLREVFEAAEPGTVNVITRCRNSSVNLRTQLLRIIAKAGLTPWPKLWQNLRSTRETELAETWPEHVVTRWIGNTSAVARKHYLQTTEEHFRKASTPTAPAVIDEAAQKQAQRNAATLGTHPQQGGDESDRDSTSLGDCGDTPSDAELCGSLAAEGMGDKGQELPRQTAVKQGEIVEAAHNPAHPTSRLKSIVSEHRHIIDRLNPTPEHREIMSAAGVMITDYLLELCYGFPIEDIAGGAAYGLEILQCLMNAGHTGIIPRPQSTSADVGKDKVSSRLESENDVSTKRKNSL
jgi:integrase